MVGAPGSNGRTACGPPPLPCERESDTTDQLWLSCGRGVVATASRPYRDRLDVLSTTIPSRGAASHGGEPVDDSADRPPPTECTTEPRHIRWGTTIAARIERESGASIDRHSMGEPVLDQSVVLLSERGRVDLVLGVVRNAPIYEQGGVEW